MTGVDKEKVDWWFVAGLFFGYPHCCIRQFQEDACAATKEKYPYPNGPWYRTGFLPCAACADRAFVDFSRFVEESIVPLRACKAPFPEGSAAIPGLTHKMIIDAIVEKRNESRRRSSAPA